MKKTVADFILHNALVWTADDALPAAHAVAVAGGRILAVGSSKEILDGYESAVTTDLKGRRLLPGLHDSHMHLLFTGHFLQRTNLIGCRSIDEMIERFRARGEDKEPIIGRGFLQDNFAEKRMPTRHDLDKVSQEQPVLAIRGCGHVVVANSKLLEMAGVKKGFGQVDGGEIGYDKDGEPNGFLAETAMALVWSVLPVPTLEATQNAVVNAARELIRVGITTAHSDDFVNSDWDKTYSAYLAAAKAGDLPLRVNHQLRFDKPQDVANFVEWRAGKDKEKSPHLTPENFAYGPIKLMCDGSLGGRTAALNEPYSDDPGNYGVQILSRAQMVAIFKEAHKAGYQLCGHAIGDKTITDIIEAFAEVIPAEDLPKARPRVIHAQVTTEKIFKRMKELHVHCDIQPAFVPSDSPFLVSRLGEERAAASYAWKTMRDMGISSSAGSDSPVEHFCPFYGIYCAVTRASADGHPAEGWNPKERLTIEESLRAYTVDAAYAAHLEKSSGRIAPGLFADFILLDRDILNIPHEEIKDIKVLAAWVDGKRIFGENL
ncbi:MAG: amidohydrolase [Spirochaetes bacterium]|nr:amidohydrolase [Spirochaetota bacterium]